MKPEQFVVPDMPYLSERGLEGLKNYQYHSSGTTALDDLHQPFWNCDSPSRTTPTRSSLPASLQALRCPCLAS